MHALPDGAGALLTWRSGGGSFCARPFPRPHPLGVAAYVRCGARRMATQMASPSPCECSRCIADSIAWFPATTPLWVSSGGRFSSEPYRTDALALMADVAIRDVTAAAAVDEVQAFISMLGNFQSALPPGFPGLERAQDMLPLVERVFRSAAAEAAGDLMTVVSAAAAVTSSQVAASDGLGDALRAVACLCTDTARANAAPGVLLALLRYILAAAPAVLSRAPTLACSATKTAMFLLDIRAEDYAVRHHGFGCLAALLQHESGGVYAAAQLTQTAHIVSLLNHLVSEPECARLQRTGLEAFARLIRCAPDAAAIAAGAGIAARAAVLRRNHPSCAAAADDVLDALSSAGIDTTFSRAACLCTALSSLEAASVDGDFLRALGHASTIRAAFSTPSAHESLRPHIQRAVDVVVAAFRRAVAAPDSELAFELIGVISILQLDKHGAFDARAVTAAAMAAGLPDLLPEAMVLLAYKDPESVFGLRRAAWLMLDEHFIPAEPQACNGALMERLRPLFNDVILTGSRDMATVARAVRIMLTGLHPDAPPPRPSPAWCHDAIWCMLAALESFSMSHCDLQRGAELAPVLLDLVLPVLAVDDSAADGLMENRLPEKVTAGLIGNLPQLRDAVEEVTSALCRCQRVSRARCVAAVLALAGAQASADGGDALDATRAYLARLAVARDVRRIADAMEVSTSHGALQSLACNALLAIGSSPATRAQLMNEPRLVGLLLATHERGSRHAGAARACVCGLAGGSRDALARFHCSGFCETPEQFDAVEPWQCSAAARIRSASCCAVRHFTGDAGRDARPACSCGAGLPALRHQATHAASLSAGAR